MARVTVIRHGQASFYSGNYDQLSPLGEEQARMLGVYWLKLGYEWDRIFVGPKQRHHQTYAQVAAVYAEAGRQLPEPERLPELDEHQGPGVVREVLSEGAEGGNTQVIPSSLKKGDEAGLQNYFRAFQEITRRWVRRELDVAGYEPWGSESS